MSRSRLHGRLVPSLALLLALAWAVALPAQVATRTEPELSGHLRRIDGIEVLFLSGDDRQQAFTEGYLCATAIHALFEDFALHNPFVPSPAAWDLAMQPLIARTTEVPERLHAWCEQVVAGMTARDPATLEIAELKRRLTADDLLGAAALPDFVGLMCSSFAVWGSHAKGDGPLIGRNLDYPATQKLLEHDMLIVRTGRKDRIDTVTLGWPGLPAVVTGMSASGVFVSIHDVPKKRIGRDKCIPRTVALLELLETCTPHGDPVVAATTLLQQWRYGMGGNVMFAWRGAKDTAPGACVFEIAPDDFTEDGVTARRPAKDETWIACSNHFRSREEPEGCWRFKALFDGVSADEAKLDLDGTRELIRRSQVGMTLHQICADLSTGTFAVRVLREKGARGKDGKWDESGVWSVTELLEEARHGAPAAAGKGN